MHSDAVTVLLDLPEFCDEHDAIDIETVWDTAFDDIPLVIVAIREILAKSRHDGHEQ